MSLHAQKWSDILVFGRTFLDFGRTFHKTIIAIKMLYFLVTRLSGVLGHNVWAVSEFYTRTAIMPGICPVSDCYLELCIPKDQCLEISVALVHLKVLHSELSLIICPFCSLINCFPFMQWPTPLW